MRLACVAPRALSRQLLTFNDPGPPKQSFGGMVFWQGNCCQFVVLMQQCTYRGLMPNRFSLAEFAARALHGILCIAVERVCALHQFRGGVNDRCQLVVLCVTSTDI